MKQKRGVFAVLVVTFLSLLLFSFVHGETAPSTTVICGTVDGCFPTTNEDCTAQGGKQIPSGDQEVMCSPGCCQIFLTNFCEYGLSKVQCEKLTEQYLGETEVEEPNDYKLTPADDQRQCLQEICGIAELTPATLLVIVKDGEGNLLEGAEARITETGAVSLTSAEGVATLHLPPGIYTLVVSFGTLSASQIAVSLTPGDELTKEVTLKALGWGKISGKIFIEVGGVQSPLEGASITLAGGPEVIAPLSSSGDGSYATSNINEGTYTLTVVKDDLRTQRLVTLPANEELQVDIVLKPEQVEGVFGAVTLDGQPIPGASIFLDGRFVHRSDAQGKYRIPVSADGASHTVYATYAGYYQSVEETFIVTEGTPVQRDLPLQPLTGLCSPEQLSEAQSLSAQDVFGREEVLIAWTPSACPQDVQGYILTRSDVPEQKREFLPQVTFFVDNEVSWGSSYTYTLQVKYKFPSQANPQASAGLTTSITLGNSLCAEQTSFCASPGAFASCNEQNDIAATQECVTTDTNGDGLPDQACGPSAGGQATCREVDTCVTNGDPFGLFYSRLQCYGNFASGTKPEKFCVFDTTETSVNSCTSCTTISSCFAYRSKDACQVNSCLPQQCEWISAAQNREPLVEYSLLEDVLEGDLQNAQFVTQETGAGYCVQAHATGTDHCSLCDASQAPFTDFFCTAQVCSGLGDCFSTSELQSCSSCEEIPTREKNCYSYVSELECTAGKKVSSLSGKISPSNDSCGWGRCLWTGTARGFSQNGCVKDGNANGKDDCLQDLSLSGAELQRCQMDNTPPQTALQAAGTSGGASGTATVSLVSPQLTVFGDETKAAAESQINNLASFSFCLLSGEASAPVSCAESDFTQVIYPVGKKTAEVNISILPFVSEAANGKKYRLLFFSEDQFKNRESVKETLIFVDKVAPSFTVKESISTVEDRTSLSVWLEDMNEPMACDFTLYQHGAETPLQGPLRKERGEGQSVTFTEMVNVVSVDLKVSCTDVVGNTHSVEEVYFFDLEEKITILAPKAFLSTTTLTFSADTSVEAECVLRNTVTGEERPFNWVAENPKRHQTSPLAGFTPGEYAGRYKIICDAYADIAPFEEAFHFTVDITPPRTKALLREGTREILHEDRLWKESFVSSVEVVLECVEEGIPCAEIFYCLGDELSCPPLPTAAYQKYEVTDASSPLKSITQSTRLCYYSKDQAGNKVFSTTCGEIEIAGFGITLLQPQPYRYQDDVFGISSSPLFAWEFFTQVPTEECRYHFLPNFVYDDVPEFQRLLPSEEKYFVSNFPAAAFQEYSEDGGIKTVYVKCKALGGELSPEQKFNLEYDPFAPTILESFAEPEILYEGIKTSLFATTDKKTLCKYDDATTGSSAFSSMQFAFPGFSERILHRSHQDVFTVNNFASTDGKKTFVLNTQCLSGAELLSSLAQLTFQVDYSDKGFILEGTLLPTGYVQGPDVPLSLQTSKSANCEYWFGETPASFSETGGTLHSATLFDLDEGIYTIPVKCLMLGSHVVESVISFAIDHKGPEITEINDGALSCGGPFVDVFVQSDEPVENYFYELFDRGNQTGTSLFSGSPSSSALSSSPPHFAVKIPILNVSKSYEQPLRISTEGLQQSHFYTVEVHAFDAAGNKGVPKESDGILLVSQNHSLCLNDTDAPRVYARISENESCRSTLAEFVCEDIIGCKNFTYFLAEAGPASSAGATLCNFSLSPSLMPRTSYFGQKISTNKSLVFCYAVEDYRGNLLQDFKTIPFVDHDGDAVADVDSCDRCLETPSGKAVNARGCSEEEVPREEEKKDLDQDSLPDYWENLHFSPSCLLNSSAPDSDGDGLGDGQEDYDADGAINYEEYLARSDPCLESDKPVVQKKEPKDQEPGEEPEPKPGPRPGPPEEPSNLVPLLLLLLGVILLFGGIGYLLYVYLSPRPSVKEMAPSTEEFFPEKKPALEKEAVALKKAPQREKARGRKKLFGAFDKESGVEHKEEIKPGLRSEEKGLFAELEGLAQKTKKKSVQELLHPEKAKDLFSQLQELSKKRKQK